MNQPPAADEIEISLLGGGNSYGECILIHAFSNEWILIDSFTEPGSKKSAAELYLNAIYPEAWKDKIHHVVATHWHDDHIRGLSSVIQQSEHINAIYLSAALNEDRFFQLVGMDDRILIQNSGVREFRNILELENVPRFRFAIEDRVLIDSNVGGITKKMVALSPSDISIRNAITFFAEKILQLEDSPVSLVVQKPSENDQSMVLSLQLGDHSVLLGADLEVNTSEERGWKRVCQTIHATKTKSIIYKVPHHGSTNGYLKDIWDNMLDPNVFAILSPYKKGSNHLPTIAGKEIILGHTLNSYITSDPKSVYTKKKRSKSTIKLLKDFNTPVSTIPYNFGHIKMRKKVDETDWRIELKGKALKLT